MKKIITILLTVGFVACNHAPSKEMIEVQGGTFIMGNEDFPDNLPRKVTLDTFQMAKYPVTVGEWKIFLKETKLPFDWEWQDQGMIGPFKDIVPTDDCPAQGLNWYYAAAYCNWLSRRDGLRPCYHIEGDVKYDITNPDTTSIYGENGERLPVVTWNKQSNGYRLPTDAEWEFAARGGNISKGFLYAGSDNPDEVMLYKRTTSYPVGQMKPNELGLYDMTGSASVWCWDWYDANPEAWQPEKNPSVDAPEDVRPFRPFDPDRKKVYRGSDWEYGISFKVFTRGDYPARYISWIGIRLVRSKL
jgi:formylglycine-generating enzyme required for sulfatase activity